jgi:hypothetical protein
LAIAPSSTAIVNANQIVSADQNRSPAGKPSNSDIEIP